MHVTGIGNITANGEIFDGTITLASSTIFDINHFSQLNTFTLNSGTLQTGVANALQWSSMRAASGGILDLDGQTISPSPTINNFTGTITNSSPTGAVLASSINASTAGNVVINAANAITFTGNFEGSGSLLVKGTGLVTSSGNNSSLTGPVTVNGTLLLNSANAGSASAGWTVASTGTLLAGYSVALGSLAGSPGGLVTGTFGNSSMVTLTIGTLGTSTACACNIANNGSAVVAIDKTGGGILTLTGLNTFTGGTTWGSGSSAPAQPRGPCKRPSRGSISALGAVRSARRL